MKDWRYWGIFILCILNCLVVVSDRNLCGGGEDGVDVNEENDFSGTRSGRERSWQGCTLAGSSPGGRHKGKFF